jgi:hypothetical protein
VEQDKSEAASKKPKRGRPPAFDPDYWNRVIRPYVPPGISTRHKQNFAYQSIAIAALEGDPSFAWIIDAKKAESGSNSKASFDGFRPGILSELGRLRDPEWIRTVARTLRGPDYGILRMSTKAAIAEIRRVRLGREPIPRRGGPYSKKKARSERLQRAIAQTLFNFQIANPGLTPGVISRTLRSMAKDFEEEKEKWWKE